mmetsp:Transcript_15954/g.20963  ORF Transcript_15954/g.20963 Transcript_15954/m.20963 type:complete len:216 (+) Transcript_15954:216-863(+)
MDLYTVVILLSCLIQSLLRTAAAQNSCQGSCGAVEPVGDCYCDNSCTLFQNCCADFAQECPEIAAQFSCSNRCTSDFDSEFDCQCDSQCTQRLDCCSDHSSLCLTSSTCEGRCGEENVGVDNCSCSATCTSTGNCCEDFVEICKDSCAGRCDESYNAGMHCHCDSGCADFNDCCSDHATVCPSPKIKNSAVSRQASIGTLSFAFLSHLIHLLNIL